MSEATSPRRARFSWFAFIFTLFALYPSSGLWLAEKTARYKSALGFVNWYAAIPPVAFYGIVVGLPVIVAVVNGLLVARWRWAGGVCAVVLVVATTIGMHTAVPTYDRLNRAAGGMDQRVCCIHLMQLGRALTMYATEHERCLPPSEAWPQALSEMRGRWLRDTYYLCPADARVPGDTDQGQITTSYTLSRFDGWPRLLVIDSPETTPLMFDGRTVCGELAQAELRHPALWLGVQPREPGLNMLFVDGHVAWVGQSDQPTYVERPAQAGPLYHP